MDLGPAGLLTAAPLAFRAIRSSDRCSLGLDKVLGPHGFRASRNAARRASNRPYSCASSQAWDLPALCRERCVGTELTPALACPSRRQRRAAPCLLAQVLRTFGHTDGTYGGEIDGIPVIVKVPIQPKPGVFSEAALRRYDFVMDALAKVCPRIKYAAPIALALMTYCHLAWTLLAAVTNS